MPELSNFVAKPFLVKLQTLIEESSACSGDTYRQSSIRTVVMYWKSVVYQ